MAHATLKDVARKSGFSVTTVSRVLGGSDYPISPEAREAIVKTAKHLEYFPNMLARSLKTRASNEVAVVMPSVSNPFYTSMITGIEGTLADGGYSMLVYFTGHHGRRDSDLMASLRGKMIAGVIIASDSIGDGLAPELASLKEGGVKVVLTDYALESPQSFVGIYFDYVKGAIMAVDALLKAGHRKIAFASCKLDRHSRRLRAEGYRVACQQAGLSEAKEAFFVYESENGFQAGVELANRIAQELSDYTAVVAVNDIVASGLLAGFAQQEVRVPEDISVIGFDDCIYAQLSTPPLTTICVPAEEMGRLAAECMLGELSGKKTAYSIYMEPEVTVRGTVGAVREG